MLPRREFLALSTLVASTCFAQERPVGERIRIAQIGTAHAHASGKMQAVRSLHDLYGVVAIAESDAKRRERSAASETYAGLTWLDEAPLLDLPDLKAVIVETTVEDATRAAAAAIEAGRHVHLDKPGGLQHEPFKAMRLAAEKRGVTVQMGYMLRYNPAFTLLQQAVREGWLGQITEIDAAMGKQAAGGLRKELGGLAGGGMFELACHVIDAAVTLLGKPKSTTAFNTPTRDDGVKDNQLAVLAYDRAAVAIRCNHADPFGAPHRYFRVFGTEGAMEIQPLESGRCKLSLTQPRGMYSKGEQSFQLDVPKGRYDGEFIDLAKVIRGEKQLAWDAAHDIAVHETVLRASGAWVE